MPDFPWRLAGTRLALVPAMDLPNLLRRKATPLLLASLAAACGGKTVGIGAGPTPDAGQASDSARTVLVDGANARRVASAPVSPVVVSTRGSSPSSTVAP